MKQYLSVLIGIVLLAGSGLARSNDDDVYGDEAWRVYKEPEKAPERAVVLPPYPSADTLIEVDPGLRDFPFTLWIDPASLVVDDEGVVRYTAVLRSESGAENVVYEGVRCSHRDYRRYAYGAQGQFHLIENPQWQFVRQVSQDRYREALIDSYFCPLPSGDRKAQILRKLRYYHPGFHE